MERTIFIFILCSLINVMLSTTKSILTVRASKGVATAINAITYGFYAIVVKQLASLDVSTTVAVTIGTNIVGVYLSICILEKFRKDNLWKISVTTQSFEIIEDLEKLEIQHYWRSVRYKHKDYFVIEIFSHNQKESNIIKGCLKNYNVKYNITELTKSL